MKIEPTTDRDLTTHRQVHTGFTDQTNPYKAHNTISLANTPKNTGSPTGPSDGGT